MAEVLISPLAKQCVVRSRIVGERALMQKNLLQKEKKTFIVLWPFLFLH